MQLFQILTLEYFKIIFYKPFVVLFHHLGMDVAASEFFKDGKYDLDFKNKDSKPEDWITSDALCEMYKGFVKDAPVVSIEDPFDQDDWAGWTKVLILIIS